jgi:hypothetical protein
MRVDAVLVRAVLLLSLGIAAKSFGQAPPRTTDWGFAPGLIVDAPFTATWQETVHDHGKFISQTTVRMARASNGSIYSAMLLPDGTASWIQIDDVPNNRMITLNVVNHAYSLSTPQGGKFHTLSVQQMTQILQSFQDAHAQGVEHPPDLRVTSLGVKQESGMTLYGRKFEWNTASKEIQEDWISSDLSVKASLKLIQPSNEYDIVGAISDIQREEPDPKLFKIPEGYNPI